MNKSQDTLPFDPLNVTLTDSNLIEASAGTGKTYSITILALRLIIEKGFGVEKILMVTYTKSAVAELEERVRVFVRHAFQYISGDNIDDSTIKKLVENSIELIGERLVEERLSNAVLFLDETAIFTIHSFCQKTLTEFAFETGEIFGNEILSNQNEIVDQAVNEYWRCHITLLEVETLTHLVQLGFSRESIQRVILSTLAGKMFVTDNSKNPIETTNECTLLTDRLVKHQTSVEEYYLANRTDLIELITEKASRNFQKLIGENVFDKERFIEVYIEKFKSKNPPKYLSKELPDFYELVEEAVHVEEELNTYYLGVINFLYKEAISFSVDLIRKTKKRKHKLTYEDLINNLHKALTTEHTNEPLIRELNFKYKAVFIDEFQDTDKLQYEIFNTAFHGNSVLFYIGDPKQSIYGFRKADIETYKKAKKEVNNIYSMDKNYRSTGELISAMNLFFSPQEGFDAFSDEEIVYEQVTKGKDVGVLTEGEKKVFPLTITACNKNEEIFENVANQIHHVLLTNQINGQNVMPSDIGVLVRSKENGVAIKNALSQLNIPAVTIDESKVMVSEEAKILGFVLAASLEPNKGNINKALLNHLTAYSINNILSFDEVAVLSNFYRLQGVWVSSGVYSALMTFITLYNVKSVLLKDQTIGERSLTNVYQVMELLHKYESSKNASPEEVLTWMRQFLDGKYVDGDEFIQRVESDNDAVNIVTIHKSKGLAYPIVFAPFLDMVSKFSGRNTLVEYRDDESGQYVYSVDKTESQIEQYEKQTEPENRRLLYVALTRAVYKCFITNNTSKKISSLKPFLEGLESVDTTSFVEYTEMMEPTGQKYQFQKQEIERIGRSTQNIELKDDSWRVLSYSGLNTHHATTTKKNELNEDHTLYDEFIFKKLPKGSITGEFLHYLFEFTDYTDSNRWDKIIQRAGKVYSKVYNEELNKEYLTHISEVVQCQLTDNRGNQFQLNQIGNKSKMAEMEFYFKVEDFNTAKLNGLSSLYQINSNQDYDGMMNGFIDLFFEYQGKYYILDWKSNHLGGDVGCYDEEGVSQAMLENNYHLQYLIYCVAVKRFLSTRIKDFDYNTHFGGVYYLFLRGVRAHEKTGVFYSFPDEELINQMDEILG